ncbi:MAG: hemerythrin family protein [Firmicutes bacterium]|jgi:hemerythrin|nr:hemerythrin family protein [Bacillota bacterium]NLO66599.1 hemerythrin family protein [Bacillota bacterium]
MMWKEHYRIGSELVDTQHQELFKRVENFIKVVQAGGSWEDRLEEVKTTLDFMQTYVIIHFNDEEELQREIGYPYLEEHARIHADFREEIHQFAKAVEEEGFTEESMQELAAKVMTWLIMHVGREDQKIGEFLRTKEAQQ